MRTRAGELLAADVLIYATGFHATDFLAPIREAKANDSAPDDLMQADGLHPSSAGVALMVEAVGPKVRELVGKAGG